MRSDPKTTIKKLIKERYPDAITTFWAGSVLKNYDTIVSDLDLVIVYQHVDHAYREAFIYDGWPIDAFVHDEDTLRYFFDESRKTSGISGLISMILNGQAMPRSSAFSENIKALAQIFFEKGPVKWDKNKIDMERFLITDILDDIIFPKSRGEQVASAVKLFESLSYFYFRAQNKWTANGKSIVRYLNENNPQLASEFIESFEEVFRESNAINLKKLTQKILQPYGGLLWDGFKSNAPKEAKMSVTEMDIDLME